MADESLGEEHVAFIQWAISHGITINGVAPAHFPGRRLGMIATRVIEEGEIMISVPVNLMITIDSIPPAFIERFPVETPAQGILAAFLIHGDGDFLSKWDAWRRVWPPRKDLEDSMPLLWPERLRAANYRRSRRSSYPSQSLLPPSASGLWNTIRKDAELIKYETKYQNLLSQQENRFQDAWKGTLSAFPDIDWNSWAYYWFIVNTRSFFYESLERPPESWNDALALVPFADYFNHADNAACEVKFDGERYTFKAALRHEKGQEVFMSYGPHPNDFLLIEYGFYLDDNESDAIFLDDIIFRELSKSEKDELNMQQYLGNYQLTADGVCSRTEMVACMKYMTRKTWMNYVLGEDLRGMDPKKTGVVIRHWIETYLKECQTTMEFIENGLIQKSCTSTNNLKLNNCEETKLNVMLDRWKQIKKLCEKALDTIA